jgi:hypothetical protein
LTQELLHSVVLVAKAVQRTQSVALVIVQVTGPFQSQNGQVQ